MWGLRSVLYIIRLDDACEFWNKANWERIEILLDRFSIRPLVGVIPCCQDPQLISYGFDEGFWDKTRCWTEKGWDIALHGCTHVYETKDGGLNPVQKRSEFAGLPYEIQQDKIASGISRLEERGISPKVFFAPSHTYDRNTISALEHCSAIRAISDTFAADSYLENGFLFVPVQSGHVTELPFRTVTFCYHPNNMEDSDFDALEAFFEKHAEEFGSFTDVLMGNVSRKKTVFDNMLQIAYFTFRKMRGL